MTEWIWQQVIGPAINGTFAFIPLWVWVIVAGLAIGWAWKQFGWQGILGAAAAILAILSYRQGWKARDSLDAEHVDGPDAEPSFTRPKPKKSISPAGDDWLKDLMNGGKR